MTTGTSIIHVVIVRKALVFENDMAKQIGMSHRLSANHLNQLTSAGNSAENE